MSTIKEPYTATVKEPFTATIKDPYTKEKKSSIDTSAELRDANRALEEEGEERSIIEDLNPCIAHERAT